MDWYDQHTLERMFKKRKICENGCWFYTGKSINRGYGCVLYVGKQWKIHRLIFYLLRRERYNPLLDVLHKCNNKLCFNPDHLYMGDESNNMIDCVSAGNCYNANKTHCPRGHEYTSVNIIRGIRGDRECRTCRYIWNENYRKQKQKEKERIKPCF